MVDFRLSPEQKELQGLARQFAEREIKPRAAQHDRTGEFPWEIVRKAHEAGLMNCAIPPEYGGPGLDAFDRVLITEELAWGCVGISVAIEITALAATPLLVAGSEEQKREFLTPLTREPMLASYCVTEPGAGSDVAGMSATAVRKGNEYVLNGTKQWITGAGYAKWFVVFAYTDKQAKHKGISAFLVPRETPGLRVGKKEEVMGQCASDTRQVSFEEVRVPVENRLGAEGEGFRIAMVTFDRSRPGVAASAVGLARRAFEEAIRYAQERKTFGVPIAQHQAIQFTLADMATELEAARLLVWKAAWATAHNETNSAAAAHAKRFAADAAMRIATDAVQVFGGYGFSKEYPVEKLMRDAKVIQIYEGTSQIQRLIIARRILEEYAV